MNNRRYNWQKCRDTSLLNKTKFVISNPAHGKVYSTQHYMIMFVSDFRQLRERPFNLKGGGALYFFLQKYSDSQWCWKKYSDFGGGKKKSDSEFLSYNIMLNSGKQFRALCDK
jgi:hypothetical protein